MEVILITEKLREHNNTSFNTFNLLYDYLIKTTTIVTIFLFKFLYSVIMEQSVFITSAEIRLNIDSVQRSKTFIFYKLILLMIWFHVQ